MDKSSYNIARVPIKNGADNYPIATSKDYLILLSAPPGAKVTVRLNDNTADEIPFSENFALECKDVSNIYISCNAVDTDEMLIFGQSSNSENFKIITAPVVKDIDSINILNQVNNFSQELLTALDKITNPFEEPTYIHGNSGATAETTIFDSILDCDKVIAFLSCETIGTSFHSCVIKVYLDNNLVKTYQRYQGWSFSNTDFIKLLNVRNKRLTIKSCVGSPGYKASYTLEKFNKKV